MIFSLSAEAELSHLLSVVLSPAVFDGPEWNAFTWNHIFIHTVHLNHKSDQFFQR